MVLGGCVDSLEISCDKFDYQVKITHWPRNTRILQEQCITDPIPTYQAKFTLLPKELPTFQTQPPLNQIVLWRSDTSSLIASSSDFHKAGRKMRSLLYADYSDGIYLLEVLIDTSNHQQYVVYFKRSCLKDSNQPLSCHLVENISH